MKFKLNVMLKWNGTTKHILDGWEEACHRAISMDYEPTCTSGMEGDHSPESAHHYGRAADFAVQDVPFELRQNLKQAAEEVLGVGYLVILKETHYHVQRNRDTF